MEFRLKPTRHRVKRRRVGASSLAVAFAAISFAAFPAAVSASTTDSFVQKALSRPTSARVNVILKTSRPLSKAEEATIGRLGGYVYRHLPIIQSAAVSVPSKSLKRLVALSFVEHVSSDSTVTKTDTFTVGSSGAATAWGYGFSGQGIGVAVLDSGVHSNADFKGNGYGNRIADGANFAPGNTLDDLCGHGTHVAGIIAGDGSNSTGPKFFKTYYGIAPSAKIINVRVLDNQGAGSVSQVISGLQWVLNWRLLKNIRVVNLSLGHPVGESYKTDPLCQAVEQVWKSGIVVVCSAGNTGRLNATQNATADNEGWGTAAGSISSPGNDPYVITVGAMKQIDQYRSHDQIATYSSRGPSAVDMVVKPDIVAPGNKIVSVLADGSYIDQQYSDVNGVPLSGYKYTSSQADSKKYFRLSGTSMAAPVVAGAAALLLQKNPLLSPDTIKARLMLSATKWRTPDGNRSLFTYGAGYLDIPSALKSTVVARRYAQSPSLYRNANGLVYLSPDRALWGEDTTQPAPPEGRALWGEGIYERALWGEDTFATPTPNDRALWGEDIYAPNSSTDRALWGEEFATPSQPTDRALWGEDFVAPATPTDRALWGEYTAVADPTDRALWGESGTSWTTILNSVNADLSRIALGGE